MRRLALVLLLLSLALPASAAAQSDPFGPLPQPAAPTATPAPIENPADQGSLSRGAIFGIGGAILLVFVAIGVYISRDARSHLTADDRRALDRERDGLPPEEGVRTVDARAKKKAREKTRAQKQARKKQRAR